MKRKIVRFILWLLGILVVICLGVFLAFQLSPKPGAWVINQLFAGEVEIKDSASYDKALPNVQLQEKHTLLQEKRIPLICIIPKRQNKRYQSFYGSMVVAMWEEISLG